MEARSVMVVNEQNSWKLTRVILVRFYPPPPSVHDVQETYYKRDMINKVEASLSTVVTNTLKCQSSWFRCRSSFFFVFRVQLNKYDFRQVVTLYEQGIITTPSTSFLNSLSKTQTLKRSMVY